ncbi:DMT family transporter [Clostridium estertheticum]|uniref:DMT family transporter n=1 Tax=Clostridium estertheticum TaxID=238834 RepID=UPI001CF4002A|nr:DMT family transporter [Clostridium estertheticum]MCB2308373.1 DMT family transporter [Clostridium estertheticum]MCB2346432.1 DMT family transporter [Clostridium estertheticum]MCB2349400.1 DMT family transporter [Clostridium estertheticum]WAG46380.1 DMT family transporter [Clostridium estertheticum]
MFQSHLGEIAALATALCWTITAVSFEAAGKKVGSISVNLIRLVIAFILISIYNLFTRGMILPIDASSSAWFWLTFSGIIGFVIGDLFLFQAYVEVGARISMLIMSTVPPITAISGFLLMGEKITVLGLLGMIITIVGISLVILTKNPGNKKVRLSHPIKGLVYAFIGALGQAFGLVFSKFGMGSYDPFAATQIRIIAAIIGFSIVISVLKKWSELIVAVKDRRAMRYISIGSLFGPFVGVSLSLLAVQHASTGVVSTITSITPILLIPVSIIVFKERIAPREIFGAIITLLGISLLFI